jgi:DNA-binding response OmpR family regulator
MTGSKEKILFVDDDAELREIVLEQLIDEGYDVEEAEDGLVAMEKLLQLKFDLVLLDIKMPGKSGLDLLRFVKERSLKCRVIMLTGVVGLATAIESLSMGADDYITKPYNLDHLLSAIRRVLEEGGKDE